MISLMKFGLNINKVVGILNAMNVNKRFFQFLVEMFKSLVKN